MQSLNGRVTKRRNTNGRGGQHGPRPFVYIMVHIIVLIHWVHTIHINVD